MQHSLSMSGTVGVQVNRAPGPGLLWKIKNLPHRLRGWRAELGPLPEHETSLDPAVIVQKARWWLEEAQRMLEKGDLGAAERFNKSLIVLLYRLEKMLKG